MRVVTRKIAKAFLARESATDKNTRTDGDSLFLFGKRIAWHHGPDRIAVTLAGWPTATTRDRLNGLCILYNDSKPFYQRDHETYYNDALVDSHDVIILEPR